MAVAYILFGFLWTVMIAVTLGLITARFIGRHFTVAAAFVVGGCPLSLAVTLIALCGGAYKAVFLALGAAVLVAGWRLRVWRQRETIAVPAWFWIGFGPFFVLYLANAMAPEVSPDGMAYHLGLVQQYAKAHRLMPVPENLYASLSQGIDMLFLFAFSFGRHSAAAMVHFAYLVSLPFLLVEFGRRSGYANAGAWAGLFVFATPVVGIDGISAYNDVALAAIWFTLFLLLADKPEGMALPAGMLAGFAYSVKYTAFTALLYLGWRFRRDPRRLALAASVAAAFVLPWVLRNAVVLGNPFAPLLNGLFPNPHVSPLFEADYSAGLRTYGQTSLFEALGNVFLRGEKVSGFLGPCWLLAPLGVISGPWLLAAAAFPLNVGTRFLIPALPFLAIGIGQTLRRWPLVAGLVLATHLLLSWPAGQRLYRGDASWFLERIPWKAALRIEKEEDYLAFRRGEYLVARMLEDFVPPGERVFSFSPLAQSYTTRPVTVSFYSTHGLQVRDGLLTPVLDYLWPMRVVTIRLGDAVRAIRIEQRVRHETESWTVSEITPRPASIQPSRAPWTAALAADGNPLTRWASGAALRPGDTLNVTFDHPVEEVTLRLTRDQWASRFQVAGSPAAINDDQETVPLRNLRRWATETVRGWGYRYLVVSREDFAAADFAARANDWNVEVVAERNGTSLYRIR